jgi:2-dehydro-3-deoxygluconokinase
VADVLTVGETMGILRFRDLGRPQRGSVAELSFGGAESNVAIAVSRLGLTAAWVGRVGDDDIGRMIVRELRAEGVSVVVTVDPDSPTGLLIASRPAPGRTAVHYHRAGSAGSRLTPDDLPSDELARAAILHVTGITPALSATARATIDAARTAGLLVSLDINYRSGLWPLAEARPHLTALVRRSDLVFGSRDELAMIAGGPLDDEALAASIAEFGPTEVVVKLGHQGALAWRDGVVERAAAEHVDVVDTVGAGDAFVAGYLTEVLANASLASRLRMANLLGAFACRSPGDWEGSPTRRDLERASAADPVER